MLKIRLYQLNPTIGDLTGNSEKMISEINKAKTAGCDLIIFPELAVCGYSPFDLLERTDFIREVLSKNEEIAHHADGISVVFGSISKNDKSSGRSLLNSIILAENKKIHAIGHKQLLPTYDVFDESRYFEPADESTLVQWQGINIGLTICEDLWQNNNDYHKYKPNPAQELSDKGADFLINISASPFTVNKPELRLEMLQNHGKKEQLPIIYVNQTGANTDIISDGDSMVINAGGNLLCRAPLFQESFLDVFWDASKMEFKSDFGIAPTAKIGKEERLFQALVFGLREYVKKTGIAEKVILGLSGGLDSALTAVIATEAFGKDRVIGVTMPSHISSKSSVSDSVSLAYNLGITIHSLPIHEMYESIEKVLRPLFDGTAFGTAEENMQSRSRGIVLMSIANKFNYLLLNTGNKSEMAVGYCTLYGDMAGGISVLADIYKTEAYAISKWLNEKYFKREVIPWNTITKPPSAELRPDQKDLDSLPEYEILDGILHQYIEEKSSVAEIVQLGYDETVVKKVIQLVDNNEYKRKQAAPGLKVSTKAFGCGRRFPIVQKWTKNQFTN